MRMSKLRDYQEGAVEALVSAWRESEQSGLVVLPTGTGKSIVQAEIIRRLGQADPTCRILALTHVRELIAQNASALLRVWPNAPLGIYSAGLGRRDGYARILFGSIQSIARQVEAIGPRDVVLIDEAHLVPDNSESQYGAVLAALRSQRPGLRVGGLTATPYRLSTGKLTEGHDGNPPVFDRVVYEAKLADMVAQGWLSPLTSKGPAFKFDLTGVRTRAGEFVPGDLESRINRDDANVRVVHQALAMAADRRSWLVFAVGHEHARALGAVLTEFGIANAVVLGDTPDRERDAAIAAFKAGQLRALVSVGVLTTGFDAPGVDCIVLARPTKSPGLYVQMLGRGTRLAPGKRDCLVLDFAGNVGRLGPVDEIDGSHGAEIQKGKGGARVKECEACLAIAKASATACPDCGTAFPKPEPKALPSELAAGAVVSWEAKTRTFLVLDVEYAHHVKDGRSSLRVMYHVDGQRFPISVFHAIEGRAFYPWQEWWGRRSRQPAPRSVDQAARMCRGLPVPSEITCRLDGKWWRVVGESFDLLSGEVAA